MSKERPRVDIVIAARNEERRLSATLAALQAQDYPPELVEIFLVDNGSTDRTMEIASRHCVTVLSVPKGKVGAVRNAGILSGNSEFVGFLDAHCVPQTSWISDHVSGFTSAEIGGSLGPFEYVCSDATLSNIADARGIGSEERLREAISGRASSLPWIPTGNAMYRRSSLESAGFFDETLSYCEDVDLSWRVFLLGYQFVLLPSAKVTHYNDDSTGFHLTKQYKLGTAVYRMGVKYGMEICKSEQFVEDKNIQRTAYSTINGSLHQQPEIPGLLRYLLWRLGFTVESLLCLCKILKPPVALLPPRALAQFRPSFRWSDNLKLNLAAEIVYWFPNRTQCVVVSTADKQRFLFEDVSAFLFHLLVLCTNRKQAIEGLTNEFQVEEDCAATDVDQFIQELLSEGVLEASQ